MNNIFYTQNGLTPAGFKHEEEKAKKMSNAGLAYAIQDARRASLVGKGLNTELKYLDQMHVYIQEKQKRIDENFI